MAELGPNWARTWLQDTAASGDGAGSVTFSTGDLTTACNSGSCAGYYLEWNGFTYSINAVTATTATLTKISADLPYAFPSGSGQRISVQHTLGTVVPGVLYAMMYDWLYSDWVAAGLDGYMQTAMGNFLTQLENEFTNLGEYPYN